ncbi:Serine/threonine-protein kinase tel1 [Puccinia graminis f. sp. tritici]|uniref:Serine/threonine-protein kinase tel1 n=1 Tax=Puccinia graminis f. sp. tritici TaxID=56615 RepID=A0A5B0N0S7_PUCGR|nr:Serine/threonine-protein kinase tel1 [Puccinia graminis f. sp. tritici]
MAPQESRWAEIFHQLFSAADTEKAAILKPSNARKGSIARASNLNRLRAALTLIRKCVVQFVSQFKHKVMKLVINRTIELIVVAKNRTLMDSIVLDCIRILRDFLLYRPHLEHLDHELSAEILAICFASILDRKLPETFSIPDNESFGAEPPLEAEPLNPTDRSQAASPRMIDSSQLLSIVIPASSSVCLECSKIPTVRLSQCIGKIPP